MFSLFKRKITLPPYLRVAYSNHKFKPDILSADNVSNQGFFSRKSFPEVMDIIKNPQNPYPKNATYYQSAMQYILEESLVNGKIMMEYGQVINMFLQDLMERIKMMGSKELSDILILLLNRAKSLRLEKEMLFTMFTHIENRMKKLIELNENSTNTPQEKLQLEDIRCQILGLFYLTKKVTILGHILRYSYKVIRDKKANINVQNPKEVKALEQAKVTYYQILYGVNQNLDDTTESVRESIADFLQENYQQGTLECHRQFLRMLVKCKFYKNSPLVRNEAWISNYIYSYMEKVFVRGQSEDLEEMLKVLNNSTIYLIHVDPWERQKMLKLVKQGKALVQEKLLAQKPYFEDQQALERDINTTSLIIKLIPTYICVAHYYHVNTLEQGHSNKINTAYIQHVIEELKPIFKHFILSYFTVQIRRVYSYQANTGLTRPNNCVFFLQKTTQSIQSFRNSLKKVSDPQKLLIKSVENLLNGITVFKDFNIVLVDFEFSLTLIETEAIYCVLCRQFIADEVRYLRLLQHTVYLIKELQKTLQANPEAYTKYTAKIDEIKTVMRQQVKNYDDVQKNYKPFSILRLVSIMQGLDLQSQYLGDAYRKIKQKKLNVYVETLSRTILKGYNLPEVIETFNMMFQGKLPVKEVELGRIVFLSAKQPQLLRYWIHSNRSQFVRKICFNTRIICNIVSIIRMDNLEINRNSIQVLSQIVTENKLHEINALSASNQEQENALIRRTLCNSLLNLFRFNKIDGMIDEVFEVYKNAPTIFRNHFTHIETVKILNFAPYLAEDQSIFYINKDNKNAIFKFVVTLLKKVPQSYRPHTHYLLGSAFYQQSLVIQVVSKLIGEYWPDSRSVSKSMPFYAEFLNFFISINCFQKLARNERPMFLILRDLLQDYRNLQQGQPYTYIASRMKQNYELLDCLATFNEEPLINKILDSVQNSTNLPHDPHIIRKFIARIQSKIKEQIQAHQATNQAQKEKQCPLSGQFPTDHNLVNRLLFQRFNNLEDYSDWTILGLNLAGVLCHGHFKMANQNMRLVIRRLLKIDPLRAKKDSSTIEKYPYEVFKLVVSNLGIYTVNRNKRLSKGQQLIETTTDISEDSINTWVAKSVLQYSSEISNNEELAEIIKTLHASKLDILPLLQQQGLPFKSYFFKIITNYLDVELLNILFSQNITAENRRTQTSNYLLFDTIKVIVQEIEETHLVNNYGLYFQAQGEQIFSNLHSLLFLIIEAEKDNPSQVLHNQALEVFKKVRELFRQFSKIYAKAKKHFQMKNSGNKYAYLYNDYQGQYIEPQLPGGNTAKKSRNVYNYQGSEQSPLSIKHLSSFCQLIELLDLLRIRKWSFDKLNKEHKECAKKINQGISKRQTHLAQHSDITYFVQTQKNVELLHLKQQGLSLYVRKVSQQICKVFYIIDPRQSLLFNHLSQKRERITGEEKIVVEYIKSILRNSPETENVADIQVKVLPYNLDKVSLGQTLSA